MKRHCPTCTCEAAQASLEEWRLAPEIFNALQRTRFAKLFLEERWWRAQFRAHNGTNFAKELLEAEAWCCSNPGRAPKKDYRRFLNEWFKRAASDE